MKILLVNGSPHKEGNTYLALQEAAKTLETEGFETEIEWIGNKPIRYCIACGACTRLSGRCTFDDDCCNRISEKANDADGFIFGSPVYYGQPNGGLLALVQRMLFSNGSAFRYKPVANVAVCRRGGASAAYTTMNLPFQMMSMPIATSQYWNIVYGQKAGEAALDAEGMQTMRIMAHNLAWMVKQANGTRPEGETQAIRTNFIR